MTKNIWVPYYYTAKIKRYPQFFIRQVLLEELPIVLLVFGLFGMGLQTGSWIALILMFMALISVYEIGYADNDRIGESKEANPKLSDAYKALGKFRIAPFAWFWAIILTAIGVAFLPINAQEAAIARLSLPANAGTFDSYLMLMAMWLGVILVSQLAFAIFNRAPLGWRVFAYVPLHVSKYFGFALIFASNLIGLVFLAAHLVRTWSIYAIRRAGGDVDYVASQLVRLVFFLLLLGILVLERGTETVFAVWQTWLILAFCVIRAVPEITKKLI